MIRVRVKDPLPFFALRFRVALSLAGRGRNNNDRLDVVTQ